MKDRSNLKSCRSGHENCSSGQIDVISKCVMNIKENIINLLNNASKKTSDKFVIGDECLAWWGEPEVSEKLMNYYNQKNENER